VPETKVLKVYNAENLKGSVLRFEESNACNEAVRFTFAQIMAIEH
jgi:hypothetical protein